MNLRLLDVCYIKVLVLNYTVQGFYAKHFHKNMHGKKFNFTNFHDILISHGRIVQSFPFCHPKNPKSEHLGAPRCLIHQIICGTVEFKLLPSKNYYTQEHVEILHRVKFQGKRLRRRGEMKLFVPKLYCCGF